MSSRRGDLLTVLVLDDRTLIAEGLARIVESFSSVRRVDRCTSSSIGLREILGHNYDCVIVRGARTDAFDGITLIGEMLELMAEIAVLAIVDAPGTSAVASAVREGARAVVVSSGGVDDLQHALESAVDGRSYVSPELAGSLVEPSRTRRVRLTDRERELLTHLANGLTVTDAADRLCCSESTVKRDRTKLYVKLGVTRLADAIEAAIAAGFLDR